MFRALAPKLASLPNIAVAAWSAAATPPNASSHRCSAILPKITLIMLIREDLKTIKTNKVLNKPKVLAERLKRDYIKKRLC